MPAESGEEVQTTDPPQTGTGVDVIYRDVPRFDPAGIESAVTELGVVPIGGPRLEAYIAPGSNRDIPGCSGQVICLIVRSIGVVASVTKLCVSTLFEPLGGLEIGDRPGADGAVA